MDPTLQAISQQTEIPLPPRPTRHPFHKKPILLMSLFVFLVIGAFFAGTYYQGMSAEKVVIGIVETSPTPIDPTSTVEPTTDWRVYMDDAYSYSFKYPEQFYTVNVLPDDLKKYGVLRTIHLEDIAYGDRAPIWIRVWDASGKTIENIEDRKTWCAEMARKFDSQSGQLSCEPDGEFKEITFNGEKAFQTSGGRDNRTVDLYYIPDKKYVVAIEATRSMSNDTYPPDTAIPVIDQILKTFRFLDSQASSSASS